MPAQIIKVSFPNCFHVKTVFIPPPLYFFLSLTGRGQGEGSETQHVLFINFGFFSLSVPKGGTLAECTAECLCFKTLACVLSL